MNFLIKLFELLDWQITTPTSYGRFHLLWWGIVIISTLLLCIAHRKRPISIHALLLGVSITVVLLELYKQLNYAVSYTDGLSFDYEWYIFPWQFCSMPMYVGLLAGIVKKGRIHDALCAFLATYAVFAGLCVMLYPGDVFTSTLGVCIQTMFCHGSMITVGIFLFFSGHVKLQHKTIFRAIPVFVVTLLIAVALNEVAFRIGLLESDPGFNMFYVSPYGDPHLPIYSTVQAHVPFPWSLAIYFATFSLAAYLILLIAMAVRRLSRLLSRHRIVQNQ